MLPAINPRLLSFSSPIPSQGAVRFAPFLLSVAAGFFLQQQFRLCCQSCKKGWAKGGSVIKVCSDKGVW